MIVRLLGAIWTLETIVAIPGMLVGATGTTEFAFRRAMLSNVLFEMVWLIVAIIIFFNSERIASFLFPGDGPALSIAATARQLQELGFSLIAVYLGVSALARVVGLIYQYIRFEPVAGQSPLADFAERRAESLVSTAVQLAICVGLFFGSKSLARFWARLRAREEG